METSLTAARPATRPGLLKRLVQRKWDVLAALAWAFFAGLRLAMVLQEPSLLQAGHFVFTLIVALLFVLRRPAKSQAGPVWFWLAAVVSVLPIVAMRPAQAGLPEPGFVIQVIGLALTLVSILTLNRSFGVAPAHRGLVMRGVYRVVRHPLYASELIAILGYCIGYASAWNWLVLALVVAGLVLRLQREEQLLRQDAEYQAYRERVRWRLVPGVW